MSTNRPGLQLSTIPEVTRRLRDDLTRDLLLPGLHAGGTVIISTAAATPPRDAVFGVGVGQEAGEPGYRGIRRKRGGGRTGPFSV
jgi:hypothetical protein